MTVEDAKRALLKSFQCYNLSGNNFERSMKFEAYWEVLRELSSDAVIAACRKAGRGEIGSPGFMPSAGEIFQEARQFQSPRENQRLCLPIDETPSRTIPPEEEAKVKEGFRKLAAELRARNSRDYGAWMPFGRVVGQVVDR